MMMPCSSEARHGKSRFRSGTFTCLHKSDQSDKTGFIHNQLNPEWPYCADDAGNVRSTWSWGQEAMRLPPSCGTTDPRSRGQGAEPQGLLLSHEVRQRRVTEKTHCVDELRLRCPSDEKGGLPAKHGCAENSMPVLKPGLGRI